jgi:hypothetical protein
MSGSYDRPTAASSDASRNALRRERSKVGANALLCAGIEPKDAPAAIRRGAENEDINFQDDRE